MINSSINVNVLKFVVAPIGLLILSILSFNGIYFYNEAGFSTHVRTIFGEEKIVT